jgi:GNAT superfamily N-acetyltransferase
MTLVIREARAGDGAAIHAMVKALAVSHNEEAHFTATPAQYEAALSDPASVIGAFIALWNGVPAGCSIWHRSFSSFRGRESLYLEDLSVLPDFRRRGIARALLGRVAQLAVARGAASVHWLMQPWNDGARTLYRDAGAEIEEGLCQWRLQGEALERLGR